MVQAVIYTYEDSLTDKILELQNDDNDESDGNPQEIIKNVTSNGRNMIFPNSFEQICALFLAR